MKGFEQRRIQYRIGAKFDRIQVVVDGVQKGSTSSFLRFQLIKWLSPQGVWILQNSSKMCFWLIFPVVTVFTTDLLSLLLLLLLPDNSHLFLNWFVLIRSLITETYPRTSIVAKLQSQKLLFLHQEILVWFSFFRDPYPICFLAKSLEP